MIARVVVEKRKRGAGSNSLIIVYISVAKASDIIPVVTGTIAEAIRMLVIENKQLQIQPRRAAGKTSAQPPKCGSLGNPR
jgi:hypothetical protein